MNTLRLAGWLVWRYVKNDGCPLDRATQIFKTAQSGPSRLESHTKSQKSGSNAVSFLLQLPVSAIEKVALAAALAVCVDVRPFSFCDFFPGTELFAQSTFEMGKRYQRMRKWILQVAFLVEQL